MAEHILGLANKRIHLNTSQGPQAAFPVDTPVRNLVLSAKMDQLFPSQDSWDLFLRKR